MAARARRYANAALALIVAAAVLFALSAGLGAIPALGHVLVPGRGIWASAAANLTAATQTLRLPGLSGPVSAAFSSAGVASIAAATDSNLFLAQGFVTASFRFDQMDLERRLGEGRLAQLDGRPLLASDKFELRLGLWRTARAEWAATSPSSQAGQALISYARGVNDWLADVAASHQWPVLDELTGAHPSRWTPVDSLVVQEVLTQQLDFGTSPLDYALLERSLGAARTMAWFPVQAVTAQQPYDPGPYRYRQPVPLAASNANAARVPAHVTAAGQRPEASQRTEAGRGARAATVAKAAAAILAGMRGLPAGEQHIHFDSNAWAASGPAVQGGRAMLAGDPHLQLTLPSDWYQVSLRSPGYDVTGASLPGIPAVVLGHNAHVTWSITDAQNQSTLFYRERTARSRPGEYFWQGAWRPMRTVHYDIPVRGSAAVPLTVDLTAHGPIMTMSGQTTSVDWMGDIPSDDLTAILRVDQATSFTDFRSALESWGAPAENFAYADDQANIAIVGAGYYPQTPAGSAPWLPMSGTGGSDVTGTIPFGEIPQVYDPPSHLVITANQRPVGPSYPYYIGTSMNFDPGYRPGEIQRALRHRTAMTVAGFARLQRNVTDGLAVALVPRLLSALATVRLSPAQRAARTLLARWNGAMTERSAAASVWSTFLTDYLSGVFEPWWSARKVPVHLDPAGLRLSDLPIPLLEDLQRWTSSAPQDKAFSPPGGSARSAPAVMRAAFSRAVSQLSRRLGPDPSAWRWGRLHSRSIPSITGSPALSYRPYPAGGDPRTVDAADGGMNSSFGPSWRMIVAWTGTGRATAESVYPGGQSGDPASPWYQNLVSTWRKGQYLSLSATAASPAARRAGAAVWTLRPPERSST
jgi:penicillin G amidase